MIPLSVVAFLIICQPLRAEKNSANSVCKVTDPTGTPLNVRVSPNGKIVNTLRNGREVYIQRTANDDRGRNWVYVSGYYDGAYRNWGWVFREFISCYDR